MPGTEEIRHRMTYGVAVNALRGLLGFLYEEGNAVCAISEVADPGLTGSFVRVGVVSVGLVE